MTQGFARSSDRDHLKWLHQYRLTDWHRKSALDLGCGSGFLCQEIAKQGAEKVFGLDIVEPSLNAASGAKGWQFLQLDLDGNDWSKQLDKVSGESRFDFVFGFDIIEHVSSPYHLLVQARSLLRPGGQLIITTPNTASWERVLKPRTWSGAQDPQHKTLFNRYSLQFILERVGFTTFTIGAPIRMLQRFVGSFHPQLGGQIICIARL